MIFYLLTRTYRHVHWYRNEVVEQKWIDNQNQEIGKSPVGEEVVGLAAKQIPVSEIYVLKYEWAPETKKCQNQKVAQEYDHVLVQFSIVELKKKIFFLSNLLLICFNLIRFSL